MGIRDLIGKLKKLRQINVVAGFPKKNGPNPFAEIALYNEYGTLNSPARPFLRTAEAKNRDRWFKVFGKEWKDFIKGELSVEEVGRRTGETMAADIMEQITSNTPPPNAPSTFRRKMSRKVDSFGNKIPGAEKTISTLIDTGEMFKAVDYKIERG